jgi:urease accessory protein
MMLDLFRAVPIARTLCAADSLPESACGYVRDTVTLGWEDRMKARGRHRTDRGVEFGTTLPRRSVLHGGDCLVFDQERLVVSVIAREEPVFVIEPATPAEWGLFAYQIGNSHQPLMLTDHEIVCPELPGMEQVLTYHRIPYARGLRAFTPVTQSSGHLHQP